MRPLNNPAKTNLTPAPPKNILSFENEFLCQKQTKLPTLRGETFTMKTFCEAKNYREFREKLSRMTSNIFHENLTFTNDYFK